MNSSPFWPMQEGINEIIATVGLHAAPIGVICRDNRIMMAVFRTSHTASLIEESGLVVANIMHDPVFFVRAAFSDLSPEEFIEMNVAGRPVYRISSSLSWVVYRATIDQKTEQKLLISLEPIETKLAQSDLVPINRGRNSIIEAAVHGTRYILTRDPVLKQMIDHHVSLVKRCGGKRDLEALCLLEKFIA
ncbi:DUF447 domain-containing protein [Methanospirillum lacunae]|uniref:DUF447 domain-containing protein n=1 Tax=Methanospirillum lacunae TaxID=668570 RepID=UPI0015E8378E|nr:DUF447 domain-containing protein [Methanospirillum lacunae]